MPEPEPAPGPWRVVKDYHGWAVRDADDWLIAVTTRKIEADRIAAVPDMEKALAIIGMDEHIDLSEGVVMVSIQTMKAIHAALAKARGE